MCYILVIQPEGGSSVVRSSVVRCLGATASTAISVITILIVVSDRAHPTFADPLNPYIPDISQGYCPGGHGGFGGGYGIFYCDGIRYPDGSYWHEVIGTDAATGRLECVLDKGSDIPPLAPPSGCAAMANQPEPSH